MKKEIINTAENAVNDDKTEYITVSKSEYNKLTDELINLREEIANLRKLVFGQKSEKTKYTDETEDGEQLGLFDEAETEANRKAPEPKTVIVERHERKERRTHEELAADLPVEEIVHELPESGRICDKCGDKLVEIGKETVRDQIKIIPAHAVIERHVRKVYGCTGCGNDETRDAALSDIEPHNIVKAEVPKPIIDHSVASPSALAYVMYEKYVNATPLYRMETDLKSKGLVISRATLANWVIAAAEQWLVPLWNEMKRHLLACPVIHADETPVQVLNEPGRRAASKSYMWVYRTGIFETEAVVLYEYSPTRAGANAGKFLSGYSGALVADGYDGYNGVTAARCGCWAHVRRKFVEALPPKDNNGAFPPGAHSVTGLEYCNRLFTIEASLRDKPPEFRSRIRQHCVKKTVDAFFSWLDTVNPSGGSKLSKAVGYARGESKYLCAFLDHPLVPISNNAAENAIRPFVIGRKNWLFSASQKGARSSAAVYSIVETAKANGIKPYDYLLFLFGILPAMKSLTSETLKLFMPWSDQVKQTCGYSPDLKRDVRQKSAESRNS
jgi:transposase